MRKLKIPSTVADQMVTAPTPIQDSNKSVMPGAVVDLFLQSKPSLEKTGPVYNPYLANQDKLDTPVEQPDEIGAFESAYNNFMIAKDAMELDMWKGMQLKAEQDPHGVYGMIKGAMKDMGNPDFFEKRIKANQEDIQKEQQRIIADPKAGEFNFTDAFKDPKSFFGTQLPLMMGGMAGLMAEPLAAGAVVAYGAGMFTGASEIATVAAAGIAAIAMSRPFESLSEGYATYDETKNAITEANTKHNLGLTPEDIETRSLQAFNDTYSKNMALSLADGAEVAIALIPMGRFAKPLINKAGTIGKIARRLDMFSKSHPVLEAAIKAGVVSQKEGFEELYQYKKSSEAYNEATKDYRQYIEDKPDTWARIFENKEAMAGYKGGLFGGIAMGGAAPVLRGAMKAINIIKDDIDTQPYQNIKEKQTVLRGELIAKAIVNGKESDLQESINIFGKTGLLSAVETNDKDSAKKSSIAEAKKLGNWAAEKSELFKSYLQRYPNLPQADITKVFTNGLLHDEYSEQLKKLNPEKVEDIPIIKDLETKIFNIAAENSTIISGKPAVQTIIEKPVDVIEKEEAEAAAQEDDDFEITSQADGTEKKVAKPRQTPLVKHLTANPTQNKGKIVAAPYNEDADAITYDVEYKVGNKTETARIASASHAKSTNINTGEEGKVGRYGLAAKEFEGKEVEMRVIRDGETDATGNKWSEATINDFTQKPYGAKVEVWTGDKFIGNIQVTNFNKKKVAPKGPGKRAMATTIAQKQIDGKDLNNAEKEFYGNNPTAVDNKVKKLKKAAVPKVSTEDKVVSKEEKNKVRKKIKKIVRQQKQESKPAKKKLSRKAKKKLASPTIIPPSSVKDEVKSVDAGTAPVSSPATNTDAINNNKSVQSTNEVTDNDFGDFIITSQSSVEKGIDFLDDLEKRLKDKRKSEGNSGRLGSFGNFTSTDVQILAVQLAKEVLKGVKSLQDIYKELKQAIFQSKKMSKEEKASMFGWVEKFKKTLENSIEDVGTRGTDAEKNLSFLTQLTDVSEQEVIENAMSFSADKRLSWMGEKVKGVWTDKNADGTPAIIRSNSGDIMPIDTRVSILSKHAKEYKSGSLRDHYAKLQERELKQAVLKNPEPILQSAHNYLKSINEVVFVWTGNNFDNNSKFGINISNQNIASKQLESVLRQVFSRHFRAIKSNVNEQGQVEEMNPQKYKDMWAEYNKTSNALKTKIANAIKARQPNPGLIDELINAQAEFLNKLTGIDSRYFVYLANDESRFRYRKGIQEKNKWDYYNVSGGNTILSQFILNSKANPFINIAKTNSAIQQFEESFTRGVFSPEKNTYINQFKQLSNLAAKEQGQTIAHSFYGVNKKFKSGVIFKSGLSVDIDRLNSDKSIWDTARTKILDKKGNYIGNPWAESRKNKETKPVYLDGTKNTNNNNALSADELSPTDIMINELVMFLEGNIATKEPGTYLQFVEQQADDGNKMYLPAKQYSLTDAKVAADKLHTTSAYNFRSTEEILKDASTVANRLAQYASQYNLPKGQAFRDTINQFVLNYEINKFLISEYLQPRYYKQGKQIKENFKEYLSGKVKRKRDGKGIGFMEKVAEQLPDGKIRQVIWNDPKTTITVGKEVFGNTELTDGFILVSEKMGEMMRKASGAMYNWHGSFKTTYNKVNDDRSITFNKANSVVLPKELIDNNIMLKKIADYMDKNNIHFLAFKSGVKQFDNKKLVSPAWAYEGSTPTLASTPAFDESQIENLDPAYYVLQQDLQYSTQLKNRNITKQLKYYLMQLPNGNEIISKLNTVSNTFKNQIEKDFFTKSEQDKVEWLLSRLPDKAENFHLKALLMHSASNLYNPKIQGKINSIFAREVESKVLNLITNGGITIEAPNFGIPLESYKKGEVGAENTFAEAMVPAGYEKSGIKEGDTIIITRVPTTDLHSISTVTVKGFLPESMGSVIMTDQGIQKIAGADNDGDARYVWAKYPEAKKGSPEELANDIFDLITADYKLPENYDKITRAIDTNKAKSFLGDIINRDKTLPHHSLLSSIRATLNNQEGQAVIGILARFNAVYNYAVKAGFSIDKINFPIFDKNERFKSNSIVSDWKDNDEIRFTLANNLNHATDNPKEGLLEYLGLTKSTSMAKSLTIALGISDEDATNFFNTEIIQEVIAEARRIDSPYNNDNYTDIFRNVEQKYLNSLPDEDQQYYSTRKLSEKAVIRSNDPQSARGRIELLQFYEYFNSVANDIYKINSVAKLLEEAPKTYGEFYEAKNNYQNLKENNLKIDIGKLLSSNLWQIVKDNIAIAEEKFEKSIMNTKAAKAIISSIEQDFRTINGNPKFKLTSDQIEILEAAINDYMTIEALETTETKQELRELVKDWYDSLDVTREPGKTLSEAFYIDAKNQRLELSQQFRNINTNNSHVPAFMNAFKQLGEMEKNMLLKYHAKEFGNNENNEYRGGFGFMFDVVTETGLQNKINNSKKILWEKEVKVANIKKQILTNNAELIPDAKWKKDSKKLVLVNKFNQPVKELPNYVKSMVKGKTIVFPKHKLEDGKWGYENNGDNYNGNFFVGYNKEGYTYENRAAKPETPETNNPTEDDIKYQLETNRELPLESTDPVFAEYVRERLRNLFPFVEVFNSKEKFETAASRVRVQPFSLHYVGSAIKNLVFVDPDKATQDTRIHEYAHIYWDALPARESTKIALIQKFGSEESAIQAIGEAGVKLLDADFNKSYNEGNWFVNKLKEFWAKVKKAFGINSKEDLAKAFAERLLTNADDITYENVKYNVEQYYQKKDFNPTAESTIARDGIVDYLKLKDISELSFSDIIDYTRPDDEANLKDLGVGESLYEKTYYRLHHEKAPIENKTIAGNLKEDKKSFAPLSIERFYKQVFKTDTSFSELQPGTKNHKMVSDLYDNYTKEFETVQKRIWSKLKNEDIIKTLRLNDKEATGAKTIDSLQSMWDFLMTLNSIAANDAKAVIGDIFVKKAVHQMILEENKEGYTNMPATKFFYDMVNGKITTDWSGVSFISGRLSMISPSNTTDSLIQLRETIMRDALRTAEAEQDAMRLKLGDIITRANKAKADWKLIYRHASEMGEYGVDPDKVPNALFYIPAYTPDIKRRNEEWAKKSPMSYKVAQKNIEKRYKEYFALRNSSNPGKKALADFLDAMHELEKQHIGYAEKSGFLRVAQIPSDVTELIKRHGWKEGIKRYLNQPSHFDEIIIQTDDLGSGKYFMTLKDAKDFVYSKQGKSAVTYPLALKKMANLDLRAQKQFESGKMANGEFIQPEQVKKINLKVGFKVKEDATENIGEATRKYYDNLIRENALEKIIPISSYAQNYFSRNNKTNITRWLKMMDNDAIYNEKPEILPKPYSNIIQTLINYTHWINLAFNVFAMPFNALQGITGTTRDIGLRATKKGAWRLGQSPITVIRMLKRLQIVNTSEDAEISVHGAAWKKFSNLVFSPITAVEYINHSYSFLGSMTDEEWDRVNGLPKTATAFDFYDAMGNGDRLKGLRRVEQLHQITQDINGSYAPFAKRGINKTSFGRAIMQFKNWLPDLVRQHYTFNTGTQELEKETMHGSQVKGIFNTVFDKPMYKEFKKNMSNESFAIAWQKLKPIDRHNLKRFMRELFMIGGFAVVWASLDEEDKDLKATINRAMQDLTYAFNPETGQYLLSSPVPIMKTVQNLLKLIEELGKSAVGNPTTYLRDTEMHDEGDWRAPVMLVEMVPMKQLAKKVFFQENEITE